MAIKVYELNQTNFNFEEISAGTFVNPVSASTSPGGSAFVKKLYLRNGDNSKWYSDIVLTPKTIIGEAISTNFLTIKLLAGDKRPADEEWASAPSNSLSILQSPIEGGPIRTRLPELGSNNGADIRYYPFWVYIKTAKGYSLGETKLSLELEYTENLI